MPLSPDVQEFLDQFSQMLEIEGLPRAGGRILGLLFINGGDHTAEELASQLMLSRGSVSTAIRPLEMLGVVQRRKQPGERVERFRLHADPFLPMMQAGVMRAQRMQGMVRDCRRSLSESTAPAIGRLQELEEFFAYSARSLTQMLEQYAHRAPNNAYRLRKETDWQ